MAIFRRKRPTGLSRYESVAPGDLEVLSAMIGAGADLRSPRHTRHYLYIRAPESAEATGSEARQAGWSVTVRPGAGDATQMLVLSERDDYVLTPEAVIQDRHFFEALANRHGGEYDGWEASI